MEEVTNNKPKKHAGLYDIILYFPIPNSNGQYLLPTGDSSEQNTTKVKPLTIFLSEKNVAAELFTREEKAQILDEYNEIISELGALNGFSLEWLCHPISEKNDLAPDTLLDRLVDFLTFHRFLLQAKEQARELLLIIPPRRPALARDIWDYTRANNIQCVITYMPGAQILNYKKGIIRTLARRILYSILLVKGVIRQQYWFMKCRSLWKRLDENKTYTVIRTWFDGRSRALMKDNKDIYFGRLPGFLKKNGLHVLYFGEFAYDFEHEFENITKGLEDPVILGRSLLHCWDFVKGFRFQLSAFKKIKFQPNLKILGIDVDTVFRNYFQAHSQDQEIRANFLSYRAAIKLLERIRIDRLYIPFENYAWEKLTRLAVSEWEKQARLAAAGYSKEVKVTFFQHAQVALNAAKFFMGEKERNSVVFPGRIVTVGEVTRRFLIERKHYPAERVVAGCALRQDYVISGERVLRKQTRRVLAQLWSVEKSARLINFLHAAGIHPGKFHVTISPHPCNPLDKLIPHLDFEYRDHFTLFTGSLKESFAANDLVIYHGTTACLDALANGLPVINVEFDDFITVDPLFDFHDFKWTVSKPEDLAGAIDAIYALSDDEYYRRQQKGFEFVKNYFYPVNDENMRKFL